MRMLKSHGLARWSSWLLAALTLLLAALLIAQCADIYLDGVSPDHLTPSGARAADIYSREAVAVRLSGIAWAFWLWLAAFVTTIVCRRIFSGTKQGSLPLEPRLRLEVMLPRIQPTKAMLGEQLKRKRAAAFCGAACAACVIMSAVYLMQLNHFTSWDLEQVMGALLLNVSPWTLIAFACLTLYAEYAHRSRLREIVAAKAAPKRELDVALKEKPDRRPILRALFYAAAITLIIAGIVNGGMYDVLVKAINICTECIGLG